MTESSKEIVHGQCRGLPGDRGPWKTPCTKRTWLYLPGRLCEKCIKKAQARMLAAIQAMEDEDG